jgi:hypothetical protein
MDIRKISVGPDYKGNAMHYIVNQDVLGGTHKVRHIKFEAETGEIKIYIINDKDEVMLWKSFNHNMPISIEYNIEY